MRMLEKDKKRLFFILLVGIIAIGYYYIYIPFNTRIHELNDDISRLEVRYITLKNRMASKEMLISDIKHMRYQTLTLDKTLPPYIEQERVILTLNTLRRISGLVIHNPSFSRVVAITEPKHISAPASQLPSLIQEASTQTEGEKAVTPIAFGDTTGIKMEVRITFTSTYPQLKKFLYEVSQYKGEIVASNITVTGQDDQLSGSMTLSFYGLVSRDRTLPRWEQDVETGKGNPFAILGDWQPQQQGSQDISTPQYHSRGYDFYMILNPITDDAPTVIVGKEDQIGSEIYADGNKMHRVVIELMVREGRYYYSYETDFGQYPRSNEEGKVFTPTSDELVLKIIDKERLNDNDRAGADVHIINRTDKQVVVTINESLQRTRANISFEGEGMVRVSN